MNVLLMLSTTGSPGADRGYLQHVGNRVGILLTGQGYICNLPDIYDALLMMMTTMLRWMMLRLVML